MPNHIIVGDGPAGITAAQVIRAHDPEATISVLSADSSPYYYRAALTNYLIGQLRDDELWGVPPDFYKRHGIGRFFGQVTALDTARNIVTLENGQTIPYDTLLVASGSSPIALDVPGANLPGVATFRTLQDARQIVDILPEVRQAVIVGAGSLGLEWVQGLRHKGVEVTYILRDRHFMPRVLDATASELVLQKLRAAGVTLIVEDEIAAIQHWQGRAAQVVTKAGREAPCQFVGVAIGVRPNIGFLKGSAVKTDRGVLTDEYLRTSVPNIFAAGDVAQTRDPRLHKHLPPVGLWQPARKQGEVAGRNMIGPALAQAYDPGALYVATHLYELDFAAVGDTNPRARAEIETLTSRPEPDVYKKLVLRDNRLIGALAIGDRKEMLVFKRLIDLAIDVSPVRDRLLDPHFELARWVGRHTATRGQQRAFHTTFATGMTSERAAHGLAGLEAKPAVSIAPPGATTPARTRTARLVLNGTPYAARPDGATIIGRAEGCDIVVLDTSVSRRHAELLAGPSGYLLRDLGSANGTWVGLTRVQSDTQYPVQHGDLIRLGEAFLAFTLSDDRDSQRSTGAATATLAPETGPALLIGPDGEIELKQEIVSLGRATDNDIVVRDARASRLQAQIVRANDGELYLRDMGSANGTMVNGARVVDAHPLRDGDTIGIGQARYTFRRGVSAGSRSRLPADVGVLTTLTGSNAGTRYPLTAGEATIGRAPDNTIVLADPLVTRQHAALSVTFSDSGSGSAIAIRDLGSSNGTWVNGQRVTAPQRLHDGDTIAIGQSSFAFTQNQSSGARPAGTTPAPAVAAGVTEIVNIVPQPGTLAPRGAEPALTFAGGPRDGARLPLPPNSTVSLGRDETNTIPVPDGRASRRHAQVSVAPDGSATLTDLGSSNGTFVNGQRLTAPQRLRDGDTVLIGDTTLRFTS